MTPEERRIHDAAVEYARVHKSRRCRELTDPVTYPGEANPVSVFMAGSPGAGKTEAAKELVAELEAKPPHLRTLRIDPDDLRCEFPGYDGRNSWLFQRPVSSWVSRMLDLAHDQKQSFLLDGTFSDLDRCRANVQRCVNKGRTVQLLYVYQDPIHAWNFVMAREAQEGRRIPPESFVEQYFGAREVVNTLKGEFGQKIAVDLLFKPIDGTPRLYRAGVDRIDYHVPEKYGREDLLRLISPTQ